MGEWFRTIPIWLLGLLLLAAMIGCAFAGAGFSRWFWERSGDAKLTEAQEGYVVTSVYALLALLVGFTFSVAVERYQVRRELVVDDASAIEAVYLKAQLLGEPHRSRFSSLLVRYAENHLELAQARRDDPIARSLIAQDDAFRRDIWTAAVPAFQSVKTLDFSTSFVDSVNELLRLDAERKAARRAQIPTTVIVLLLFYSLVAAAVFGAVMTRRKGQQISAALFALNVLALMLVTDLNRPVEGTIHEPQEPMERMIARLKANPPPVYQRLALPAG